MTDLTIFKGDDKTWDVTFSDDVGSPIDITGYTVFFTAKTDSTAADNVAVISKDVTSHTDAVNGETQIILTNSDTDIEASVYTYDIQLVSDTGTVTTIVVGKLRVVQEVTRRIA